MLELPSRLERTSSATIYQQSQRIDAMRDRAMIEAVTACVVPKILLEPEPDVAGAPRRRKGQDRYQDFGPFLNPIWNMSVLRIMAAMRNWVTMLAERRRPRGPGGHRVHHDEDAKGTGLLAVVSEWS